jgi:hypothetical protein
MGLASYQAPSLDRDSFDDFFVMAQQGNQSGHGATVFRVKRIFVLGGNFIDGAVWTMCRDEQVPGHAMVARACRPVQGRFAPAQPVACGNP